MPPSEHTTQRSNRRSVLAWAVLGTAVLQVIAPLVTLNGPGASPSEGSGPDLLITPVGWAFSIWTVIYALAIAQAVAVLVTRTSGLPPQLQVAQVLLHLGAALWIVLAGLDSSLTTAATLVLMWLAGGVALLLVARASVTPGWLATLTRVTVGLYVGWVTAAAFLNVSTALADEGVFDADELPWQLVMLVAATLTLLALAIASRGVIAYAAAGIWALVGIAVTGREDGNSEVVVVALIAVVLLSLVTAMLHLRRGARVVAI